MDDCALYSDPVLYDLLFPDARRVSSLADPARAARILGSEEFYLGEATQAGGRVLELACGTGRLTIPLAQNGIEIVGADNSESMLNAARTKARSSGVSATFVHADMRNFELPDRFSAILIPGNSLLHLQTIADLKQCLAHVRSHLAPGGLIVFDVAMWDLRLLTRDPDERVVAYVINDPVRGEIRVEETAVYDTVKQVRDVTLYIRTGDSLTEHEIHYSLRVLFPQELMLLLESAGFHLEARYGEFPRHPFDQTSPRQVCICSVI